MRTFDLEQYWPNSVEANSVAPDEAAREPVNSTAAIPIEQPAPSDPVPEAEAKSDWRMPFVWGGLGFIAGMIAWHIIGFWAFVSHVVFSDETKAATITSADKPLVTGALADQRLDAAGSNGSDELIHRPNLARCIALAIDREHGEARPSACSAAMEPLRDAGRQQRADLALKRPHLQDPANWAGTTDADAASPTIETPPESVSEPTTENASVAIDETAFDLEIKSAP